MPIALPDWVPWWVPLTLLVPALLYALAFLFMPFSVIGVKSRLEVIEARLDELQNEVRHLALRLPVPSRESDFEDVYAAPPVEPKRPPDPVVVRPPIPPAAYELPEDHYDAPEDRPPPPPHTRPIRRSETPPRPPRSEPRLNWPR